MNILEGNNIDTIKTIDDESIDLVITSPPYFNSCKKYQRGGGSHYTSDFEEPLYNIIDIMELIKTKLKKGGVVCLNLGFSYGETGIMRPFDIINRLRNKLGYYVVDNIIWTKRNPIPLRNRLTNAYEYIFVLSNMPHIKYNNQKHTLNIINLSVQSYKGHNAVMPLDLVIYLLNIFSKPGDLVLDPYLGSGTTAMGCKQLERRCIGLEINPEYVKLSKERLLNK